MAAPRRRSASVTLGITALLAASLTACGSDGSDDVDNVAVCVDPATNQRVQDDQCNDSDKNYSGSGIGSGFLWYYLGTLSGGRGYPAIGARVGGGTYNSPVGTRVQRGGGNPNGGSVMRGGFGSSGKTSGS